MYLCWTLEAALPSYAPAGAFRVTMGSGQGDVLVALELPVWGGEKGRKRERKGKGTNGEWGGLGRAGRDMTARWRRVWNGGVRAVLGVLVLGALIRCGPGLSGRGHAEGYMPEEASRVVAER
jgi:hypothetical protein